MRQYPQTDRQTEGPHDKGQRPETNDQASNKQSNKQKRANKQASKHSSMQTTNQPTHASQKAQQPRPLRREDGQQLAQNKQQATITSEEKRKGHNKPNKHLQIMRASEDCKRQKSKRTNYSANSTQYDEPTSTRRPAISTKNARQHNTSTAAIPTLGKHTQKIQKARARDNRQQITANHKKQARRTKQQIKNLEKQAQQRQQSPQTSQQSTIKMQVTRSNQQPTTAVPTTVMQ